MKYYVVVALLLSVSLSQFCEGACDICIIFYGGNNCSSCQANYYLNSSLNQCIACPQNQFSSTGSTSVSDCIYRCRIASGCSTCINSTSCSFCSQNYYMMGNGICSQCPAGQYTPPNNTLSNCIACANLCYSCSSASDDCLSCPADYYLDSTCIPCSIGYYQLEQNTGSSCISCIQSYCQIFSGLYTTINCTTCTAYSYLFGFISEVSGSIIFNCQPCLMGQYTPASNTLTSCLQCPLPYCLTCNSTACLTCPEGYYLNGPYCLPCVFPCQFCSNANVCSSCIFPGALNGTSCVTCPQATYLANGICQACPTGCYACGLDYFSNFYCYTCIANYQFSDDQVCQSCQSEANCPLCPSDCQTCSQNGSCLTCMPIYYFYSYLCIPCPQDCYSCLNQNTCTSCGSGYYLYEDLCYSCPIYQTTFGITTQHFCCSNNCSSCLNNMTCLTCGQNFYMTQGSMCTACPYGLFTDLGNTNTSCLLPCATGCSSCYSFSGPCVTCFGGYYLSSGYCVINPSNNTSNDTNNNSGSGLPKSTIIVLSTVIPVCVLVIIGIIVYCVQKKKKQSTIGTTDKPRTSDVEIGDRKYTKLTETNLDTK